MQANNTPLPLDGDRRHAYNKFGQNLVERGINMRFLSCLLLSMVFISSAPAQVIIADAVKLTHIAGPGAGEVVVDESESGFLVTGEWRQGTFSGGYLDSYLWIGASDTNLCAGCWVADVPVAGSYEVSVWYTAGGNRSSDVYYNVLHADGSSQVVVDQTIGGNWAPLGTYRFENQGYIQVTNQVSSDIVPDVTVDDGDVLFSTTGSWTVGTVSEGFADDYLYSMCGQVPSRTATWEIPVMVAGNYQVDAWYSPGGNRNDAAHYRVAYSGGNRERRIDQSQGDDGWHSLGVYPFDSGIYTMTLDNEGPTDKVVIADAFRLTYDENQSELAASFDFSYNDIPTPASGESFWVTAGIWSPHQIISVTGEHWFEGQGPVTTDFHDDGLHNDKQPGDNIYGGAFPGGPAGTVLNYRLWAVSDTGLSGHSETLRCLVAYPESTTPEMRWIFGYRWWNEELIDAMLERIRQANFNALCVSVRSVADAFYESSYEPKNALIAEGFDPLAYLIEKAHDTSDGKAYIEVHPLVLVYRVLTVDTPPPGHVLDLHPEWISENYDGEQYVGRMYQDQGIPEVQDYLVDVFMEIISNYDVDGFNLDFIRYREQNFGYNPIALSYFHHFTGRSDRPVIDDSDWCDWRRQMVTDLVKRFYANVLREKPDVLLSVDAVTWNEVQPTKESNRFWWGTYQDYPGWLNNHYIDLALGMAYRDEREPELAGQFDDWLNYLVSIKGDRAGSVIVGAYKNSVQNTLLQMHRVRKSGSRIVSVFSEGNNNSEGTPTEDFFAAVRSQVFPNAVPVPEWPWKSEVTSGVVMGRAFVGSAPLRRVRVALGTRETMTDLCGFFVFFEVPPGEYPMTVYDPAGEPLQTAEVSIDGGGQVVEQNFELPSGVPGNVWLVD